MSVRIRLTKTGRTHQVSFRIVAQDSKTKRDGKFLEILGYFLPQKNDEIHIDELKLKKWLEKGALPTIGVSKLLSKHKAKHENNGKSS